VLFDYFNDISFSQPWFFALFALLPLMAVWYFIKGNKQTGAVIISDASAKNLSSAKASLRHIPFLLRLIAVSCIIVALARPQTPPLCSRQKARAWILCCVWM
jgi:Ca-activated chloride channel homolog